MVSTTIWMIATMSIMRVTSAPSPRRTTCQQRPRDHRGQADPGDDRHQALGGGDEVATTTMGRPQHGACTTTTNSSTTPREITWSRTKLDSISGTPTAAASSTCPRSATSRPTARRSRWGMVRCGSAPDRILASSADPHRVGRRQIVRPPCAPPSTTHQPARHQPR